MTGRSTAPSGTSLALVRQTWTAWNADKAPRLAASISFAAAFSLAPLLIIVIALAGAVLGLGNGGHGHHLVEDEILGHVRSAAGPEAASALRAMVTSAFGQPRQSTIAQAIGWITFVLGAAGVFAALQDALNAIWHVEPQRRSLRETLRGRVGPAVMLVAIGLLLLGSMLLNVAISAAGEELQRDAFPGAGFVAAAAGNAVSIGVTVLLFALIFKVLPDAVVSWRDVWPGAIITAVLFVVGNVMISLYLAHLALASAYGAVGSLLAILLWVYYSTMLLLFGAEFTKVYAARHGRAFG